MLEDTGQRSVELDARNGACAPGGKGGRWDGAHGQGGRALMPPAAARRWGGGEGVVARPGTRSPKGEQPWVENRRNQISAWKLQIKHTNKANFCRQKKDNWAQIASAINQGRESKGPFSGRPVA